MHAQSEQGIRCCPAKCCAPSQHLHPRNPPHSDHPPKLTVRLSLHSELAHGEVGLLLDGTGRLERSLVLGEPAGGIVRSERQVLARQASALTLLHPKITRVPQKRVNLTRKGPIHGSSHTRLCSKEPGLDVKNGLIDLGVISVVIAMTLE